MTKGLKYFQSFYTNQFRTGKERMYCCRNELNAFTRLFDEKSARITNTTMFCLLHNCLIRRMHHIRIEKIRFKMKRVQDIHHLEQVKKLIKIS